MSAHGKLYDQVYNVDRQAKLEAADKRYMARKRKLIAKAQLKADLEDSQPSESGTNLIERLTDERDTAQAQRNEKEVSCSDIEPNLSSQNEIY